MSSIHLASAFSSTLNPTVFLIVFGIYIAGMIGISIILSRKQSTGEGFLLGNRSVPFFLILGTTIATLVGTGSSMGAVGAGYETGWKGAFFGLGGATGMILLALLFSKVRKYNFMTMSEEISYYYGADRKIKNLIGFITYIASIGWLGAHIMGGAKYLSWVSGIELLHCKLIITAAFSVYIIVGGYLAVVWTDTVQAVVLFFGFILMGILACNEIGAIQKLGEIAGERADIFFSQPILPAISLAVAIAVSTLTVPSFRQRIYSGDTVSNIRKSFLISGILYLFFSFFPAIIGIAAYQINPALADADHAFTYLASDVLPLGIGIIVLVAGLSATMSSASSDAIAGVAILLRDLYHLFFGKLPSRKDSLRLSRIGVVLTTLIALSFTLFSTGVIGYIKDMVSIVFSGMFACMILGRFWKRATWQGGLASIVAGSGTALAFLFQPTWKAYWGNAVIPAVLLAIGAGIVVSLVTPRRTISDREALQILEDERNTMEKA